MPEKDKVPALDPGPAAGLNSAAYSFPGTPVPSRLDPHPGQPSPGPGDRAGADLPSPRIARIRRRYQTGPAWISIQRARAYTEAWRDSEGTAEHTVVRVARAQAHVLSTVEPCVDPDDRIAGAATEFFLGAPVDIERGVYNQVLAFELSRGNMLKSRVRSGVTAAWKLSRAGVLGAFIQERRRSRRAGKLPLDLSLDPMPERRVNPFCIRPDDRKVLQETLLPYWKGKTLVDDLERELRARSIIAPGLRSLADALPGNTSRQVQMVSTGATLASIQGHLILDFDSVLSLGLSGLVRRLHERLAQPQRDDEARAHLEAQWIGLEALRTWARRLANRASAAAQAAPPELRPALLDMAAACARAPELPATSFQEAVQALWTLKCATEVTNPLNLQCFGRLDLTLEPFYARDLLAGRITRAGARELLEELLLKVMSQNLRPESNVLGPFYHRFFGSSPVTVGGLREDGSDATSAMSTLVVEAAARSRAVTNISVRVHPHTPDALLDTVAQALAEGSSNLSLFNDEVNVEAMRRRGFSETDARHYAVMGCVETTCPGKTASMSANALLLVRLLDITLRNGDSRAPAGLVHGDGPRTGTPESFATFEAFLGAFLTQARAALERLVAGSNLRDELYAQRLPAPVLSALTEGCLDNARDITGGGAVYGLSGVSLINSIANVTDGLLAIRHLVFEQRRWTLQQLLEAVDANFDGFPDIEEALRTLPGKWGNGAAESDALAERVMHALCDEVHRHRTPNGAPFVSYAISMTAHTIDGRLSIASVDGRKAGMPYASSANPANVDRSGVTAVLRSVAALPSRDLMGCAVNVRFHPTAIGEPPHARKKWVALLRTYFALGGSQLQPTVASRDTLLAAQQAPEQFRDLLVKVGGYSTYFVDLGREIQDEIISRTEH